MRIVKGNWPEARLLPHVAGLLLREVLGMKVEYVQDGAKEANASRMYDMLAKDEADLALTLWPAKFFFTDRKKALDSKCSRSSTNLCMTTVGNQGYQARSGWFVNSDAVKGEVAEWSTVLNLYKPTATDRLMKARDPRIFSRESDSDPSPNPTLNPPTGARALHRELVRVGGI